MVHRDPPGIDDDHTYEPWVFKALKRTRRRGNEAATVKPSEVFPFEIPRSQPFTPERRREYLEDLGPPPTPPTDPAPSRQRSDPCKARRDSKGPAPVYRKYNHTTGRHEAHDPRTRKPVRTMEDSGALAVAAQHTVPQFPDKSYAPAEQPSVDARKDVSPIAALARPVVEPVMATAVDTAPGDQAVAGPAASGQATAGMPSSNQSTGHSEAPHSIDDIEQPQSPTSTNARFAANTLANITAAYHKDPGSPTAYVESAAGISAYDDDDFDAFAFEEGQQDNMQAFAMLCFQDGDYYVRHPKLTLGRNAKIHESWKSARKQQKRARQAMEQYAKEPSQRGDDGAAHDPSSKSSQSLEGRPAPALPSNYSEQGGIVSFHDPEDGLLRRKKGKRRLLTSKSSSTASIAPASLVANHVYVEDENHPDFLDDPDMAFIPVHPAILDDIRFISTKHLRIEHDQDEGRWKLTILGQSAIVNDILHHRDEVIDLDHGDEVTVKSLSFTFKLPRNVDPDASPSGATFDDEAELDASSQPQTSPIRRLSHVVDEADSDDEGEESAIKRPKLKLSLGKKKQQQQQQPAADKTAKKKPKASTEASPEATKKPDKGKRPVMASKEPANQAPSESIEPKAETAEPGATAAAPDKEVKEKKPSAADRPINLEGTGLEILQPEQLPQKRKGPGRPPKNGLVSKRDLSFVKRKEKDYQKRGLPVPEFTEMLREVREENKIRDAQAKAQASGQPQPMQQMPPGVMPSIEGESMAATPMTHPPVPIDGDAKISSTPIEGMRRSSPKPKRQARSPSPVKPIEECTEEELKKPATTYVHQLDEILREIGKGDLQEIYDKMMKRWPYYKHVVGTTGWQSSVRHNLLQNPRFEEDGKSGKGKMWRINYDVSLEKEKKKRPTPPRMPPPQNWPGHLGYATQPGYGYGQAGGQQYGQQYPQYQQGQQPPPGYGAPGTAYPPSQGQYPQQPPQHQGQATAQPTQPPRPASNEPPAEFAKIVNEIMAWRGRYLSNIPPNSAEYNSREEVFKKYIEILSHNYHAIDKPGMQMRSEEATTEQERYVSGEMKKIFDKFAAIRAAERRAQEEARMAAALQAASNGGTAAPAGSVGGQQQPQLASTAVNNGQQVPAQPGVNSQPQLQNASNGSVATATTGGQQPTGQAPAPAQQHAAPSSTNGPGHQHYAAGSAAPMASNLQQPASQVAINGRQQQAPDQTTTFASAQPQPQPSATYSSQANQQAYSTASRTSTPSAVTAHAAQPAPYNPPTSGTISAQTPLQAVPQSGVAPPATATQQQQPQTAQPTAHGAPAPQQAVPAQSGPQSSTPQSASNTLQVPPPATTPAIIPQAMTATPAPQPPMQASHTFGQTPAAATSTPAPVPPPVPASQPPSASTPVSAQSPAAAAAPAAVNGTGTTSNTNGTKPADQTNAATSPAAMLQASNKRTLEDVGTDDGEAKRQKTE